MHLVPPLNIAVKIVFLNIAELFVFKCWIWRFLGTRAVGFRIDLCLCPATNHIFLYIVDKTTQFMSRGLTEVPIHDLFLLSPGVQPWRHQTGGVVWCWESRDPPCVSSGDSSVLHALDGGAWRKQVAIPFTCSPKLSCCYFWIGEAIPTQRDQSHWTVEPWTLLPRLAIISHVGHFFSPVLLVPYFFSI